MFDLGFLELEYDPHLEQVIVLKNVVVHVVGDRSKFSWNRAAAYGSPVLGYANKQNEIWVLGRRKGGKIMVNQAVIGHELNHLLHFHIQEIADPDKLDEFGS